MYRQECILDHWKYEVAARSARPCLLLYQRVCQQGRQHRVGKEGRQRTIGHEGVQHMIGEEEKHQMICQDRFGRKTRDN